MSAPFTRRSLLQAGSIALGAVVVPAVVSVALPGEMLPRGSPAALPAVFDPAAFVADLEAAGYEAVGYYPIPLGREPAKPSTYFICPPKGRGFDATYGAVMAKWGNAMDACPDHVDRVVAYVFQQARRAAA